MTLSDYWTVDIEIQTGSGTRQMQAYRDEESARLDKAYDINGWRLFLDSGEADVNGSLVILIGTSRDAGYFLGFAEERMVRMGSPSIEQFRSRPRSREAFDAYIRVEHYDGRKVMFLTEDAVKYSFRPLRESAQKTLPFE